ncbi:AAA family ATPase [Rhizobacter fulvus]
MIRSYTADRKSYELLPSDYGHFPGANVFTVIVGKNGTGKSRMLRNIALDLLQDAIDPNAFEREERIRMRQYKPATVDKLRIPNKVICVSASPFDRFPMLRRSEWSRAYSYLGLRGLPSNNLGLSYMSRIMGALISAALQGQEHLRTLEDVLSYLGYQPIIESTFQLSLSSRIISEVLASPNPVQAIRDSAGRMPMFPLSDGGFALRRLNEASDQDLSDAMDALRRATKVLEKPRFAVFLEPKSVMTTSHLSPHEVNSLISIGLARLREVTFRKQGSDAKFHMSEASSGEQSVVMSLLGIGSQIEDHSLICIDEPEVCLHPAWQEKYVQLLVTTFERYRGCHFLIATHSPQVVAELPQANCFVMAMETGAAFSARNYSHRSIDFQLAKVFSAPGRRNEYLSRIALNTFSKVAKQKKFHEEDIEIMDLLRELRPQLNADDPLENLIASLEDMAADYA